MLFYVCPIVSIWQRGDLISLALVITAMPYSLISGDIVFSLPVTLSCMLVGLSSVGRSGDVNEMGVRHG